jgi:hypothetical protein
LGEGGNGVAGALVSLRSNIFWNPQLPGYTSSFFKLADISGNASPTVDYCAPANCDYNTGFGHTLNDSRRSRYTNEGKGYAAKFSAPPGQHDVDSDPRFADYQRTVELFDSKYLGNRSALWNSNAMYTVGDFVRSSHASVYWSLPVNYRYVNAGACAGANPMPGTGTNWRDCWEWASLYRLRTAIAAGTTIQDGALTIEGDSACAAGVPLTPTIALVCWIRRGYATGNAAAWSGHDGANVGAVPMSTLGHGLGLGLP